MNKSFLNYLPTCLYTLAVSVLTFFIVYRAGFLFGDQHQFLTTTALGHILPLSRYVIPELGRFFPLGITDYNVLLLFFSAPSATAHYAINAICFVLTALLLYLLCRDILGERSTANETIAAITSLFLLSRVYMVFLDLIFPERVMTLMIVAFMFFAWRFWQTEQIGYMVGALIATVYMTYCKEPMFGAVFVFCGVILCFGQHLSKQKKIFLWLLVGNSIIFLALYYLLVYRNIGTAYDGSHGETNIWNTYFHMLYSQKILLVAIPVLLYRLYAFIAKKDRSHLFFDALLLSGFAYFGACLVLGLNFTYYYFPSVCLMTPPILYFLNYYLKKYWVVGIMSLLCLFYVAKLPKTIKDNQGARIDTYASVEALVNDYNNGYEIVWQECQEDDWENVLCEWRRESLLAYFNYITKDADYSFSAEPHQDRYILLTNSPSDCNWKFDISMDKIGE